MIDLLFLLKTKIVGIRCTLEPPQWENNKKIYKLVPLKAMKTFKATERGLYCAISDHESSSV